MATPGWLHHPHTSVGDSRDSSTSDQGKHLQMVASVTSALGLAMVVIGALGLANLLPLATVSSPLIVPCVIALGVFLVRLSYNLSRTPFAARMRTSFTSRTVTWTLMLLMLFWLAALIAQQRGDAIGANIAADPRRSPAVAIYAETNLKLEGSGVRTTDITSPNSKYRFRHSGLRLLTKAGDTYILLPEGWRSAHSDRVILMVDSSDVRVEFGK